METLARLIALMITAEGAFALFFPGKARYASESFNQADSSVKKWSGLFLSALGAALLYISRQRLAAPAAHWIIAVYGIFLALCGLLLVLFPAASGRRLAWFYAEKGPASLTGAILAAAGGVLFLLP